MVTLLRNNKFFVSALNDLKCCIVVEQALKCTFFSVAKMQKKKSKKTLFLVKLLDERYNFVGYMKVEKIDSAITFDKFYLQKNCENLQDFLITRFKV